MGSYINATGDWQLISVTCKNGETSVGTWSGYDPAKDKSIENISVPAGQTVACTFTNKAGPLAVTLDSFAAEATGVGVTWPG